MTRPATVARGANPHRTAVIDRTLRVLRTFLDELTNGTTNFVSVHNLTEQIEHQYLGRFALELIQNGHDAIAAARRGGERRIALELVPDEGKFGTLYAANDGRPFTDKDFDAIANLGQSAKNPNEAIGNKGIGFRSVLQVCAIPEIYSRASEDDAVFGGYCFRFDPAVIPAVVTAVRRLLTGGVRAEWCFGDETFALDYERAGQLRETCRLRGQDPQEQVQLLSPYLMPVPAVARTEPLSRFAEEGYATVIRLELRDAQATGDVERALGEVESDTLLFLRNVEQLNVTVDGRLRCMTRKERRRGTRYAVTLRSSPDAQRHFWLWRTLFGRNDHERARLRKATEKLPKAWRALHNVPVEIAVERAVTPEPGRIYTYLPTEESSGTAASFNAPFFVGMDRRAIRFDEELNALLLDRLTTLARSAIDELIDGGDEEAGAVVDLVAPLPSTPTGAFERWHGRSVANGLVTRRILKTDDKWRAPGTVRLLETIEGPRYFTIPRLRSVAVFDCAIEALRSRHPQLRSLLERLGQRHAPSTEELARTVEAAAKALLAGGGGSWTDFWEDVRRLIPDATALQSRRVAVDSTGVLRPPGPTKGHPRMFFPNSAGEDGEAEAPAPPPSLRQHVAFLSDAVPLTVQVGSIRQQTAIYAYLRLLIARYDRSEIISRFLIGALPERAAGLTDAEEQVCADVLGWTLALFETARSKDTLRPLLPQIRVPCRGGWFRADEALIGPGWHGMGEKVARLLERIATPSARRAGARLVLPPEDPAWRGTAAAMTRVLADVAIFDGLRADPVEETWSCRFYAFRGHPPTLPPAPPPDIPAAIWNGYASTVASRLEGETQRGNYFAYDPTRVLTVPGLDHLDALPPRDREAFTEILIGSIGRWPPGWSSAWISREDRGTWREVPSPLWHALREVSWIVVDGDASSAARPRDSWAMPDLSARERVYYEHLRPLPKKLSDHLHDEATRRALVDLGVNEWNESVRSGDPALLQALADAWAEGRVKPQHAAAFVNQVEAAWSRFDIGTAASMPSSVVVRIGTETRVLQDGEPFCLPFVGYRFPAQGPYAAVPVLAIAPADASASSGQLRNRFAGRVTNLSELDLEIWSGDERADLREAKPLPDSDYGWLLQFTLTIARFGLPDRGGSIGAATFREWVAALSKARIAKIAGLGIRVVGSGFAGQRHSEPAVWLPASSLLAFDADATLMDLADPLQQVLGRADLGVAISYALERLQASGGAVAVNHARVTSALGALRITDVQLAAVEREIADDLEWIVRRVAPAVLLLGNPAAVERLRSAQTEQDALDVIASNVSGVTADEIVRMARQARTAWDMGSALHEAVGDRCSLPLWNEALRGVGEPAIENKAALQEWRDHMDAARGPLRALIRAMSASGAAFQATQELIDAVKPGDDLAAEFWEVPFSAPMGAVAEVLELRGLRDDLADALTSSHSAEHLVQNLEHLGVEPRVDPAATLAENEARLKRLVTPVARVATAWARKRGAPVPAAAALAGDEASRRLRETQGPLVRLEERELIAILVATLLPLNEATELLRLVGDATATALPAAAGLSPDEIAAAAQAIERERDRRKAAAIPRVKVCGATFDADEGTFADVWDHVTTQTATLASASLDLKAVAILEAPRRRAPSSSGSGAPRGGRNRRNHLSEGERNLIGYSGEVYAYQVLLRQYGPDVVNPSTWKSALSERRFGPRPEVDDGFGCDFKLRVGKHDYFVEVKASTDDDEYFELGSSEVKRAIQTAEKPRSTFLILHVVRISEATPRHRVLPNPFSTKYASLFRLDDVGQGVRYSTRAGELAQ